MWVLYFIISLKNTEKNMLKAKISLFILLTFIFSCNDSGRNKEKDINILSDSVGVSVPTISGLGDMKYAIDTNNVFNTAARFLSGMPVSSVNSYYSLTNSAKWLGYSKEMDSSWNMVNEKRLMAMEAWSVSELHSDTSNSDVFYPFSGPDVLNATIFFPKAKNYYMMALEPLGKLPDLAEIKEENYDTLFASVEQSLSDIFKKSYFITRRMEVHLKKNKVNGITPLICLFLVRRGCIIKDVKYISVPDNGIPLAWNTIDSLQGKKNRGVQVSFYKPGDTTTNNIFYFKVNLQDNSLKANNGFRNYIFKLNNLNSYLKSASYLLHYRDFSLIRDFMLNHSLMLLQDDSGIAYKYVNKTKWNIQLYGSYTKPVADFSGVDQMDLKKAYETDSTVKNLPFDIGYRWGRKKPNLMVARKK